MKVLVDTSVWSRALRVGATRGDPAATRLAGILGKADVVLTGLILQEVLQGFRKEAELRRVARHMETFSLLQLDREHYVAAARLRHACAAKGVTATTADCQIAAAAIQHRCALFAVDADFDAMAACVPLRLLK